MNTADALKSLQAKQKALKSKGYIKVSMDYKEYILPYDDGITLLKALEHAEVFDSGYSDTHATLNQMDASLFKFAPMGENAYLAIKLSHMMQIPLAKATAALQEPQKDE